MAPRWRTLIAARKTFSDCLKISPTQVSPRLYKERLTKSASITPLCPSRPSRPLHPTPIQPIRRLLSANRNPQWRLLAGQPVFLSPRLDCNHFHINGDLMVRSSLARITMFTLSLACNLPTLVTTLWSLQTFTERSRAQWPSFPCPIGVMPLGTTTLPPELTPATIIPTPIILAARQLVRRLTEWPSPESRA